MIKKWQLLSSKDVSPSKWFPIEERIYRLPDGQIVDDFTVTTVADVAMIVPVTTDGRIILIKQYKPGVDEIMLQFPAGRIEKNHTDILNTAQHELEEETGIKVEKNQLTQFAKLTGFSTKASEVVFCFLARDCEFNSEQNLDSTEEIEIVPMSVQELEAAISSNQIWCAQTIAAWDLAKKKFSEIFSAL